MEREDLLFEIVKSDPQGDEVLARAAKFELGKAAFDKALFLFPNDHLEMRHGARIVLKSKE
jgi:hypothetical protein